MDEPAEEGFTEKENDSFTSVATEKTHITESDGDDATSGKEVNEALPEDKESAYKEPDALENDSDPEEGKQDTDCAQLEIPRGGDQDTIKGLEDDVATAFVENDADLATGGLLDHEMSAAEIDGDEKDSRQETDGFSVEEKISGTTDPESSNELESKPQGSVLEEDLPTTSSRDLQDTYLLTEHEDVADKNHQQKQEEDEDISVMPIELDESMDEFQKSETLKMVEDSTLEKKDSNFHDDQENEDRSIVEKEIVTDNLDESKDEFQKSETSKIVENSILEKKDSNSYNDQEDDEENEDRSIIEEIVTDNPDRYLQQHDNNFEQNAQVNNTSEVEDAPSHIDGEGSEGTTEHFDDVEGRESGFQEGQENYDDEENRSIPEAVERDGLKDEEKRSEMDNVSLHSEIHDNEGALARDEVQDSHSKERATYESYLEDDFLANDRVSGGFYGDDDLSSIFSDDGRDMSNILQENRILKEAMSQLRNDNPDGFTDTVSETSDEIDDFHSYPYGTGTDHKLQTSKWMADKDLSDARINEMLREKRDNQAKIRQIEREKAIVERRYRQDKIERDFLEERFNLKSSQLEDEIRNLKQENQRLKRGNTQGKVTTSSLGVKSFEGSKEPGIASLSDDNNGRSPGQNGYALDIAILAKENEKLSEIIDHLQDAPISDPLNDFVENLDKYVPKEEYVKLEKEKLKLETALREKERMLKDQERLMEEMKFDLEEELEILKDNLKKAENRNKEKAKLLSQNDIKMVDIKAKFTEKVSKLESKLEQEVFKKEKLESVIVNLKKCNNSFEKEIHDMNNRVEKLQKQELEVEAKTRRKMEDLQERLRKETEEKNKLSRNVEALLQDLMHLKSKMLEDSEKHAKEKELLRESVETEKARIIAGRENENWRLKAELDEERKRNEQLIRRMADIPRETIASVMESTTESGIFEGAFNDMEPEGLLESTIQEKQYNEPERDNIVSDMNEGRTKSEERSWNSTTLTEDNSGDTNRLQKKVLEVTKYNSIMKRRNKEIEEENINLKEKIERVGRDVTKMRELEDKNEELQEEIARNTKKRSEMQKKLDDMIEEIDDITKNLNKVEGNNAYLSDEVERLTKKIKMMEEEFADEKSKLTSSMELDKKNAIDETERRLEEQKARGKKLDNEIEDLQCDIRTLIDAKRAAEEKYVNDTKELVERHNSELAKERERYRQLQDELNNNAGAVRRVTEEWEQMLRSAVSRYEDDLQKNEDERRKLADEFQRQKEAMKSRFEKEKAKLEQRIIEIERNARSPPDAISSYQDLQIDLFYDQAPQEGYSEDENYAIRDIAEANDKIKGLQNEKQKLEQKLAQIHKQYEKQKTDLEKRQREETQKLEEALKEDFKRRMEENKKYYEDHLDDIRRKHEKEEAELAERFKKEKKELEEKIKQDFSNNLSSRSTGLENKIQDLVSQKVQEQKDIAKKTEEKYNTALAQMKTRVKEMQSERNEMKRRFEREKNVLEATIQALTKELEKGKQEKKDLKKKQKKDKAEMEEAFENEKKEMRQIWEKCKLDTINQIEEEWIEKVKSENAKSEILREELRGDFEARMKQMKLKFKAEKAELEKRLANATSEANSLAEAKKDMEATMEEDYRRKLQKEKENIESTLQGLRQEIARLREHRKQLQSQMSNREGRANVSVPLSMENNAQVLAKLDNEYQEQIRREKEHHEGRMREMEEEIEKLHVDLSQMKTKARQEKSKVKAEFEREREEMEEQFEKERSEWRTRMNFIATIQPGGSQRRSAHFERRSRDLRERELYHSDRNPHRMQHSGEARSQQHYDVLSSTGEL